MSENSIDRPFKTLGTQLKSIRVRRKETLAEVAGSVEIDPDILSTYEEGTDCPGEDILLLLISHFATKDDVADKLWELAGYDQDDPNIQNTSNHNHSQNGMIVLPIDSRIVYTDMVHVMVNNYGVVMNFMQTSPGNNQPLAVSRIGMSREHAKSVVELLQKTLALQTPKRIK